METSNHDISEQNRNSVLNHIIDCANCALQNEDVFQKAMLGLAGELRSVFESEFCSIGIVSDGYAEDCVISYEKFEDDELSKQQEIFLQSVKHFSVDDDSFVVCLALKSNKDIFFLQDNNQFNDYEYYQTILTSGQVKNSYVIPLRDKTKKNFGFIQFINSKKKIDYERDIQPYKNALLGLVQIIINNKKNSQELIKRDNRLRDADFYNMMQEKRANVDELLDSIMNYFSVEFNAAVVSFRVPIFNDNSTNPIFYLRHLYINQYITGNNRKELKINYTQSRRLKRRDDMTGIENLKCHEQGECILSKSDDYFTFQEFGLSLYENVLMLPIFRDYNQLRSKNAQRKKMYYYNDDESSNSAEPYSRLYGTFQLRISKINLSDSNHEYRIDLSETRIRLSYLSKQISLLLNSIVNQFETGSLQEFQEELRKSSFIKIKEFDERCVEIIKNSVHAKVCSVYRYNELSKSLTLNATTAKKISHSNYIFNKETILKQCYIPEDTSNNVLSKAFKTKSSKIILDITDPNIHQSVFIEAIDISPNKYNRVSRNSHEIRGKNIIPDEFKTAMIIPMLNKDGTCAGVVFLLGKEKHENSISTVFWEHDINHIEFIVNMLTRMSESDTERLTFLAQLSHELLSPVTQLVYANDLILNISERNYDSISKRQLLEKIRENVDRNMLFKYIISDTEFIYSSTGRSIDYNIVKQEQPQAILLDAIRLLEKRAHIKGLTIITFIKEMPPLYFDKERMMQVFLNLLKNAIRYSDTDTEIRISYAKRDDSFHEIRFANFGSGIKPEEKEAIFELFHRGEEAKKKFIRGTGMGLYIVRDIMRAHGGDCYVRQLNNPTEFVITLPNKE